jgi:hypothetical protein
MMDAVVVMKHGKHTVSIKLKITTYKSGVQSIIICGCTKVFVPIIIVLIANNTVLSYILYNTYIYVYIYKHNNISMQLPYHSI